MRASSWQTKHLRANRTHTAFGLYLTLVVRLVDETEENLNEVSVSTVCYTAVVPRRPRMADEATKLRTISQNRNTSKNSNNSSNNTISMIRLPIVPITMLIITLEKLAFG